MLIANANCIKYLVQHHLIASIGNELHYFYKNLNRTTVCVKCQTSPRDKIHGIDAKTMNVDVDEYDHKGNTLQPLYEHYIVAHAGYEIVFTIIHKTSFKQLHRFKLNDWTKCVKFSWDPRIIYVLTARNSLAEIRIDFKTGKANIIRRVSNSDSSTLYTVTIIGELWDALYIFSGTAFGEINIWRPTGKGETRLLIKGAHNGVITSISVNLQKNLMITTSDDRSVQFWKIEHTQESLQFKSDDDKLFFERQLKADKTYKVFGHTARVFGSHIIVDKSGDNAYVLSTGEDSRLCLWSSDGQLLYKKDYNGGAIWGLDHGDNFAFVSLANGSLNQVSLENKFDNQGVPQKEQSMNDTPVKVRILKDLLLVLTEKGDLLHKKLVLKSKVEPYNEFKRLKIGHQAKICTMEHKQNRIYFLTIKGDLIVIDVKENSELNLSQTVKISLNCSIARSMHFPDDSTVLVASSNGEAVLLSNDLEVIRQLTIPKCNEPWATASISYKNILLIADRCGNLHLYNESPKVPKFTLKKLHGSLGITSIKLKQDSNEMFSVETTGHDGTIKTVIVTADKLRLTFTMKTQVKWIERTINDIVFGFNDSHFVAFRLNEGIVLEIECGGGHRMWDVSLQDSYVQFVFIQHKKLYHKVFDISHILRPYFDFSNTNWHTNACNTAVALNDNLLISGGETNELKFHKILINASDDISLELMIKSQAHISSIKYMIVTNDKLSGDQILFSIGGRAQICVTRLLKDAEEVVEETSYSLLSTDVERSRAGLAQNVSLDPETRFTSATFSLDSSTLIVGCSDGYIRFFSLDWTVEPIKIYFCSEILYDRCILHVTMLPNGTLLSMATDGYIIFWSTRNDGELCAKLKHHQNGVDCFDVFYDKEHDEYLVATGGDDQAISITEFKFNSSNEVIFQPTNTFSSIHTAQVTGIKFINKNLIVSCGVDQMVYKIEFNKNIKEPKIFSQYFTNVADVKGIQINGKQLVIYGNGVEIKEL